MELVSVAALRPGYVLAKAVTNSSGAMLCPSGSRLTEGLIERLKNAGVEAAVVEAADRSGPTPEERIAELNERFEGVHNPIMLRIKATIDNRLSLIRLEN